MKTTESVPFSELPEYLQHDAVMHIESRVPWMNFAQVSDRRIEFVLTPKDVDTQKQKIGGLVLTYDGLPVVTLGLNLSDSMDAMQLASAIHIVREYLFDHLDMHTIVMTLSELKEYTEGLHGHTSRQAVHVRTLIKILEGGPSWIG